MDRHRAKFSTSPTGLASLLDVPLRVSVELGHATLRLDHAAALRDGNIVELDRFAGEPLDVKIGGKLVARGEAVVVNGKLGVRLTEILGSRGGPQS